MLTNRVDHDKLTIVLIMINDRVFQCKLSLRTSNLTIVFTMLNDRVNYAKRLCWLW